MSNIISEWRKQTEAKDGSITKACETLSMMCGNDINPSRIGEMEIGKRPVPDCIHWHMINICLLTLLDEKGVDTSPLKYGEYYSIVNRLMPPKRVK